MKFCNYWKIYWYLIYLKGEKKKWRYLQATAVIDCSKINSKLLL